MSNDKDNSASAPDLPRSDAPANQDTRGRFLPGNKAGAQFQRGAPSPRTKHGLRARKRTTIDRRRAVDRRVLATIAAVEDALGERLSPQRRLILAGIGRRLRDLAKMEAFETEHGLFDLRGGKRALTGVTEAKQKLLESIDRALERIGLDVTRSKARDLADVLGKYRAAAGVEPGDDDTDDDDGETVVELDDQGDGEPTGAPALEVAGEPVSSRPRS